MKIRLLSAFFFISILAMSSQNLPYYEIPEAPKEYTAGTVAGRMIDGLGFRFYWATEGLTPKDLGFKPTKESRTSEETITHILGLSQVILNATMNIPNTNEKASMTFDQKRKQILENLKKASDKLKKTKDLSKLKIIFGENEFQFWNAMNGPIADAMWHVGQIVSFRRSTGNPFPKGISVFTGKVKK